MKNLIIFILIVTSLFAFSENYAKEKVKAAIELTDKIKTFHFYSKENDTLESYSYYLKNNKKIKHGEYVYIRGITDNKSYNIIVKFYEHGIPVKSASRKIISK